jgi:hypothetical protein
MGPVLTCFYTIGAVDPQKFGSSARVILVT